ncbi:PAS domain S-box protein [Chitiniphilus purpureus]|uniref:histidine kinase n=1 Tax=Chitiniphilus purpureus TaxID=2981137 RepID=A0ABY6DNW6_9NEIS|nr:PAS domain-containing sensor histidine kinase [Chitiniphilus sp. CD1]UXY15176.1 PAS domain S-box protein [Chitiniphilus sp. CD1]
MTPTRAHRWLALVPGLLAALVTLALAGYLLLSHGEAAEQRAALLEQDLLWQKQAIEQQVAIDRDAVHGLAATLSGADYNSPIFQARVLSLLQTSPEVVGLSVQDRFGHVEWHATQAAWALPYRGEPGWGDVWVSHGQPRLRYAVLTPDRRRMLVMVLALDRLLQQQVPWWIAQRYQITLYGNEGRPLASKFQRQLDPAGVIGNIDLGNPPVGLSLKAEVYQTPANPVTGALPWIVFGLALAMLASTWALGRVMRVREEAESRLRAETALRKAMEDSLVTGLRAMDHHGRVLYVNRAFCEMVGYRSEELIGHSPPMPYWPPEEMARCEAVFDAILAGRLDPNGFTVRFMRRNGERFDVRVYASRLIDGEGEHIGWMGSMYDITEIRREREALQASHERFVTVMNGLDAAVAVTDAQTGELLMSNQQFDRAFGLPDWRGRCCVLPFVLRRVDPPVDAEWYDSYRRHWYQVKSRQSVWVDGSAVWLEIATDITALKTATERERQQNETLQQTARLISMGEMASSLAHELNQPLGAIASYASGCRNILAANSPNLAQLDQAIDKMAEQAKRAGHIIRGIREFVQRRAPHRKRCDIGTLLDTVLGLLGHEVARRGVAVSIAQAEGLPPLYADAVMLEQVLFNLIKNALEAMDNTSAEQRRLAISLARQEGSLKVTIADRGAGITPEQLEQLFKPFFTTKDTGMGMGLNICRSIIEHHHGRLWAEANPGGGCRFIFTVPFSEETDAHEP